MKLPKIFFLHETHIVLAQVLVKILFYIFWTILKQRNLLWGKP